MRKAQGVYYFEGARVLYLLYAGCTLLYLENGIRVLEYKPYMVEGRWRVPTLRKQTRGYIVWWTGDLVWTFV